MTLVLNCMTQDFVVQVSDRRLTFRDGSLADDRANKVVVYCGHFIIGYTGLAELGDASGPGGSSGTDWWIANELGNAPPQPQEGFEHLAAAASLAVARLGVRGDTRMTSIGAIGWARQSRQDDRLVPILIVISNYEDARSRRRPTEDAFTIAAKPLPSDQPYYLSWLGQPPTPDEAKRINRLVRRAVPAGPNAVVGVLADGIRGVANRNRTVGRDLMATFMPKSAIEAGNSGLWVPLSGIPSKDAVSAVYLPDQAGSVIYSPNTVCGGLITGGAEMWVGTTPPWWSAGST